MIFLIAHWGSSDWTVSSDTRNTSTSFHGSTASTDKNRVTSKFLLIKNVAVQPKFRFNIDNY